MIKRIKKRYIFVVLLSVVMICLHACMTFRMSKKEVDAYFTSRHIAVTQSSYSKGSREIHYIHTGDTTKPLVLFIHGSPGSLSAFIGFLADTALLKETLLVSTDRPGFGYSNFGNAEPSLEKQAALLRPILEKYRNNRPTVLVGHSLGGPLIARIAMDYPDLVDGLIIVAGSIDPALEPNETWFRAPLATPFLSWIMPRSFRASNEEIYHLRPELEKMMPLWGNIRVPVIVIQGKKDALVDPGNAAFAKKMITNASVRIVYKDDMNHFVPWSNPELIREAILQFEQEALLKVPGTSYGVR